MKDAEWCIIEKVSPAVLEIARAWERDYFERTGTEHDVRALAKIASDLSHYDEIFLNDHVSRTLRKLCKGVRALGSGFEIHLKPSEESPEEWAVMAVAGGAAILINTDFGPIDEVLDQALRRLAAISTRTLAAVRQSPLPPAPDTEKEK